MGLEPARGARRGQTDHKSTLDAGCSRLLSEYTSSNSGKGDTRYKAREDVKTLRSCSGLFVGGSKLAALVSTHCSGSECRTPDAGRLNAFEQRV